MDDCDIHDLKIALLNRDENTASKLIDQIADLNKRTDRMSDTILILACKQNLTNVVSKLIAKKVNLNLKNFYGFTALMEACDYNYVDVGNKLIENGAYLDVQDYEGYTALTWYLRRFRQDKVNYELFFKLIDYGADIFIKDNRGRLAMDGTKFSNLWTLEKIIEYIRKNNLNKILESIDEETIIGSSFKNPNADLNTIDIIVSFIA